MLEKIAPHDALPGRPLGIEAEVIDALGMEVGARERFEIGPVDDRIVLEDDRLAHAATHHVLPDREMAGVAADFALAHRAARPEEPTSALTSLMRRSNAVFCVTTKQTKPDHR